MRYFVHFLWQRRWRLLLLRLKTLGRIIWIVEWRRRIRYSTVVICMPRARYDWIWWELICLISWRFVKCCEGYSRAACRMTRSNEEFRARKVLSRVWINRLRGYLLLRRDEWGEVWQRRVKCWVIGFILPDTRGYFIPRDTVVWLYCVSIGFFGV